MCSRPLEMASTVYKTEICTATAMARKTSQICIFNDKNNRFCTLCTCVFHFCTFLSRSRKICNVKWLNFKFNEKREHTTANLNFLYFLLQPLLPFRLSDSSASFKTKLKNHVKVSKTWIKRHFRCRRRRRSKAAYSTSCALPTKTKLENAGEPCRKKHGLFFR